MKLPKIYEHFKQGQIFTIREAREKLQTTGNTLRKRLSELSTRGYIFPIRQGLYRVAKIGEKPDKVKCNPYAIAAKLTPYSYVGFSSALVFHAKMAPKENSTIYVVSPTKFNSFKFEEVNYFWCQAPEPHGLETALIKNEEIEFPLLLTNFEKSIIDCLKRPAHCPPFNELIELCRKTDRPPNLDKILKYASDCSTNALFNRLGFLLEKNQEFWNVPNDCFAVIENKMSRKQIDWPIQYNEKHITETEKLFLQSNKANGTQTRDDPLSAGSKNRWKIQFPEQNQRN